MVGPLPWLGLDGVARRSLEFFPGVCRQLCGERLDVGHGVVAEDKADPRVLVPAVEVFGLGESGVAAEQHAAKAGAQAQLHGDIDFTGGAFVGGAVAGAVDQAEDLAGLGQTEDQRMVAPGAVVGDVHALLAAAGRCDQAAIHVEGGLGEKGRRLLGPDLAADVVEDVAQGGEIGGPEAAAEVAGPTIPPRWRCSTPCSATART